MRGSGAGAPDWATPGWMAASSPSKRKVRIGPPNPIGEGFAVFDSYAVNPAQVYPSCTMRKMHAPVTDGAPL